MGNSKNMNQQSSNQFQQQQFNTSTTINNNNTSNSRKIDTDNYSVSNIVLSLGFANGIAALCSTPLEVVKVSEIRSCLQKVKTSNSITIQGGAPLQGMPDDQHLRLR